MMPYGAHHAIARPLRRQSGAAFLLFILGLIGVLSVAALSAGRFASSAQLQLQESQTILEQSKKALLAHLTAPDLGGSARRLGELQLFPDLPLAAGSGNDSTEPNYDGLAETAGCATRTWTPGAALTPVSASGASARCFGRLPWQELGLSVSQAAITPDSGLVPWVVLSPNLAVASACLQNLNPLTASISYVSYGCPSALPYPWITVVDERGNVISNRVAFAMIIPGTALSTQTRGAGAPPSAYLDRVVIGAGCPAPCVPGTYDNAAYNHADGTPTVLIKGALSGPQSMRIDYYGVAYEFNDRLVYVTVDEYFAELEARARLQLLKVLKAYKTAKGYYPFAAALSDTSGDCQVGLRLGHPAIGVGTCNAGDELAMPNWWIAGGWHNYFVYAASPRCIVGNTACNGPGLTVTSRTDVNAIVIAPRIAITSAPFAASRLLAQTPWLGGVLSANAADYLDSIENAAGAVDVFESTLGAPAPNNDRLDIVE